MRAKVKPLSSGTSKRHLSYRMMPLLELITCIVLRSDRDALKELQDNRALFHHKRDKTLLLVDYIAAIAQDALARQWCGYNDIALDHAYDLTIDKYYNIPTHTTGCHSSKEQGPDCRYYFGAFIDCAKARLKAKLVTDTVKAEMVVAWTLQGHVRRHFYFSCLEARRRIQKLVRRYIWKLNGHTLYLWIPVELPGRQCQKWLEANIPDLDPDRVGEQDRVQALVDRLLGRRRIFSLSNLKSFEQILPTGPLSPPPMIKEQISVNGLAKVVADEKAENIELQRPAIKRLEEGKLRRLIQTVFTELACGNYEEKRIADSFELSRATFSRFAGSRWSHNLKDPIVNSVPDLWRNTAQTLAGHDNFVLAAQKAGVWKRVSAVLATDEYGGRA